LAGKFRQSALTKCNTLYPDIVSYKAQVYTNIHI